jgi:hypothetical protein
MSNDDRVYFAQRAAEEQELADAAKGDAATAHRKLQLAYLERASVGDRETDDQAPIG